MPARPQLLFVLRRLSKDLVSAVLLVVPGLGVTGGGQTCRMEALPMAAGFIPFVLRVLLALVGWPSD